MHHASLFVCIYCTTIIYYAKVLIFHRSIISENHVHAYEHGMSCLLAARSSPPDQNYKACDILLYVYSMLHHMEIIKIRRQSDFFVSGVRNGY